MVVSYLLSPFKVKTKLWLLKLVIQFMIFHKLRIPITIDNPEELEKEQLWLSNKDK